MVDKLPLQSVELPCSSVWTGHTANGTVRKEDNIEQKKKGENL